MVREDVQERTEVQYSTGVQAASEEGSRVKKGTVSWEARTTTRRAT